MVVAFVVLICIVSVAVGGGGIDDDGRRQVWVGREGSVVSGDW